MWLKLRYREYLKYSKGYHSIAKHQTCSISLSSLNFIINRRIYEFQKGIEHPIIINKNDSGQSWTTLPLTCQGRSQSRGIGHAPTQAPIVAPCAGTQIANSNLPLGLQKFQMKYNQVISINDHGLAFVDEVHVSYSVNSC